MNELTIALKAFMTDDGVEVVDSRDVAKIIGREHNYLLKAIKRYKEHAESSNITEVKNYFSDFFLPSSYMDVTGRTVPCYLITKKGCEFLANKMTGQKGTEFTILYINAFHIMQDALFQCYGAYPIDVVAKRYASERHRKLGRNRAFEILRYSKHLMSHGAHRNVPYQEHIDNGHMLYVTTHKATEFGAKSFSVVLIPEQFVDYFFNVFDKYYYLQCKVPTVRQIKLF